MESSLELLEEKFRRVEQANERTAFFEHEWQRRDLIDSPKEPRKHHKKPAVSVSHFGEQGEHEDDSPRSLVPSPLSAAASKSAFYHSLANPRSVESLVLEEDMQDADGQHEIQVERIAGRQTFPQTVGALLPRRLIRTQSQIDYTSIKRGVVIDVLIETTTDTFNAPSNAHTSTAYAARPSRSRAATVGILTRHGGLVERAKDFARKLRQKGRAELP